MPFSAGLRHSRIALSPISRHPSASIRISPTSPFRSLHALQRSPLRPIIDHLRLYDQSSASLHYSTRKEAEEHEHKQRNANTRAPGAPVLPRLSGEARQLFMKDFMAWVDEKDPAPLWYTLQWWLRHVYEAAPTHRITLTMPDEASCEAACDALHKVCNRWDGWVGALRTSYVCIVVGTDTLGTLEQVGGIDVTREALMDCTVDIRHETHAISTSSRPQIDIYASDHDKREARWRLLRSGINFEKSFLGDYSMVAILGTALLTCLITKAMGGSDEPQGGSNRK